MTHDALVCMGGWVVEWLGLMDEINAGVEWGPPDV